MFAVVTFKHHKLRHHVAWVGCSCGVLLVRRRVRIGKPGVIEFVMTRVLKSSKVSVAVGVVDIRFRFGLREFVIAVAVGVEARAEIRAHF